MVIRGRGRSSPHPSFGFASLLAQDVQGSGPSGTGAAMAPSPQRFGVRAGQSLGGETVTAREDGEGAIEPLVDLDGGPSIGPAPSIGEDLEVMRSEAHGVVVAHAATVLEAAHRGEIETVRDGTKGGGSLRRGASEALIMAGQIGREEGIGTGEIVDPGEAQFADQAILEGAPEALDAALGLGRGGRDPLDAQLGEGPTDLGGIRAAAQLFLERERCLFGAVEDPVMVGVHGDRESVGGDDLLEEHQVAGGILMLAEDCAEHGAGRIIDSVEQDEGGAALLEPGVMAAVELDEQSRSRHTLPAQAVFGGAPPPRAAQAGRAEDAVNGGMGEDEILALGQELGEVAVIHSGVGRLGEADEALPDGGTDPARGRSAPIPMDEGFGAASAVGAPKTTELAHRESDEGCRLGHEHLPTLQGIEDHEPLLRTLRQGDHASPVRTGRGRTLSLKS